MEARNRVGCPTGPPVQEFLNNLHLVARNRVGIGLSYRPARLHSQAELVPWNRFLSSLSFKIRAQTTQPGGIGSL